MPTKTTFDDATRRLIKCIKEHGPITARHAMELTGEQVSAVGRKLCAWQRHFNDIECVGQATGLWREKQDARDVRNKLTCAPLAGYDPYAGVLRPGALDFKAIPSRYS